MAFSQSLIPPIFSFSLILMMLAGKVLSQGDVTSFQYDSFEPNTPGLTYERDVFVPSSSDYLSLIGAGTSGNPQVSSVGRVLYSTPVNFWEQGRQSSFETTIRFAIRPINNNPADGMTFFIIPVNSTRPTGGEGGNLGIYNGVVPGTRIFNVEMDVYSNAGEDPNFRHIGININSRVSANVTNFQNSIGQVTTVRINYDAPTRRIDVVATYGSQSSSVSYVYDLKTLLPQQVQVGISASTGPSLVAFFDVFSWYFTSSLIWDGNDLDKETYIREVVM